jgi:leucyl aminopeptidase
MHKNIALSVKTFLPVHALTLSEFEAVRDGLGPIATLAAAQDFKGQSGRILFVHGQDGRLASVYFGLGKAFEPSTFGGLAGKLPAGDFGLVTQIPDGHAQSVLTAFLLGCYVFDRYKRKPAKTGRLVPPDGSDADAASRIIGAVTMGRDLVNTPPNDMGPDALEAAAVALGDVHGADIEIIKGDELLAQNYPLIHAVGRGYSQAPRLVILRIGNASAPKLALVGKGVTFDTGGLNLKPGTGMALMKKDMGGAACVLALFSSLAQTRLNVRLSLLWKIVWTGIPSAPATLSSRAMVCL